MSLIEQFFPNLADMLDRQFDLTFEMTDNKYLGAVWMGFEQSAGFDPVAG